jgi:hypothetical protein
MLCSNGHENPAAATFCMTCGLALSPQQPSATDESGLAGAAMSREQGDPGCPAWRSPSIVAAAVVAVVVVATGAFALMSGDDKETKQVATDAAQSTEAAPKPPLQVAYGECIGARGWKTLTLGDEGHSLIIDTESEYGPLGGLTCVLGQLGTSQAIVAQMESTTAMMGVQEADDGSLHYQFSYHPDNGVNMVITDESVD